MNNRFERYINRLQSLNIEQTLINPQSSVLILSGSSTLEHAELSTMQKEAMARWASEGNQTVPTNFPYNRGFIEKNPIYPNLFLASLNNILYYFYSWKSRAFRVELIRHLEPILSGNDIVIVTISSGLHMLAHFLESKREIVKNTRLTIIALGPISHKHFRYEGVELVVIKGKSDWYARLLDRHDVDIWVESNHFDYLKNEQVCELIGNYIQKNTC